MINITSTMAIVCFLFLLLIAISFLTSKKGQPWNWPFLGMLHIWFPISTNIFDSFTKILERNKGTFVFKGPWFCGQDMIITCDPSNFQHLLSSKFSNYPKGSDTYTLFEPYGKFMFTADFEEWRSHRRIFNALMASDQGNPYKFSADIFKNGMIPVLDHASELGLVLNLNDVFRRLFLDISTLSTTGFNHGSLSVGEFQEENPILKAMVDINHGILLRHVLPEKIWKLQRWLGIGQEKKVIEGTRILKELITKLIKKQEGHKDGKSEGKLSLMISSLSISEELKTDLIKGIILASIDTAGGALGWFFFLVQENPAVETKIRQEIDEIIKLSEERVIVFEDPAELNELVYLHAAILEALRLYPSVPLQCRTCVRTDILPSGHRVESGTKIVLSVYSTTRMKSIWGEDCCEYKPERWISETKSGGSRILPVSSTKFPAFSSGSRICPGKDLGILRLKSAAATIIHNYDIKLLKDYPTIPSAEIMSGMKYPFHAKIKKRSH